MSLLEVRAVKSLGSFELDTSWRVPGGVTALFGYSGAGKSLTLAMLAGTVRHDVGRITFGGRVLSDSRTGAFVAPQERRFGYVPQGSSLFPHMTAVENVAYALREVPRRDRRDRARAVLDELGVGTLADRRPRELSGGQRQRVALARALAARPGLLLLDEPFSALDLPVRAEMRDVLARLHAERGVPMVLVTHDLHEAVGLADTLVVYSGSGVTQVGPPGEVLADPGCPEIRRLVRSVDLPVSSSVRRCATLQPVSKGDDRRAALSA